MGNNILWGLITSTEHFHEAVKTGPSAVYIQQQWNLKVKYIQQRNKDLDMDLEILDMVTPQLTPRFSRLLKPFWFNCHRRKNATILSVSILACGRVQRLVIQNPTKTNTVKSGIPEKWNTADPTRKQRKTQPSDSGNKLFSVSLDNSGPRGSGPTLNKQGEHFQQWVCWRCYCQSLQRVPRETMSDVTRPFLTESAFCVSWSVCVLSITP